MATQQTPELRTDALIEALDAIWLAYSHVAQHGVSDLPYPSPEGGGPQVVPCSKAEFVAAFKYMGNTARVALKQVPDTELIESVRRVNTERKARAPQTSACLDEDILSLVRSFQIGRLTVAWRADDLWAVTDCGSVLASDGEWLYEPLPSNRTDEFKAKTRFDRDTAIGLAKKLQEASR
jgi:hypothetical protein